MNLKNISGEVIFSAAVETVKDLVTVAVNAKVNLQSANLRSANLQYADLQYAKNKEIAEAITSVLPEGNLVGWKKCRGDIIVKVLIPHRAKRSNSTGRKCRAEYVKILQVFGGEVGISSYDEKTFYRKGEIVKCNTWNDDRWTECGGGIHFFITRVEAEAY